MGESVQASVAHRLRKWLGTSGASIATRCPDRFPDLQDAGFGPVFRGLWQPVPGKLASLRQPVSATGCLLILPLGFWAGVNAGPVTGTGDCADGWTAGISWFGWVLRVILGRGWRPSGFAKECSMSCWLWCGWVSGSLTRRVCWVAGRWFLDVMESGGSKVGQGDGAGSGDGHACE